MAHQQRNNNPTGPKAIKVCMVGQACAGKTCLVARFQTGTYEPGQVTIGVSFVPYTIALNKSTLQKSQYQQYLTRFFSNPDHKSLYPVVPQPTQDVVQNKNGTASTTIPPPTDPDVIHSRMLSSFRSN
jgi:GTPase SAR1 family protein